MHPVESLGELARCTGLAAEAVGDARELHRELIQGKDPAGMVTTERELRGGDQAQVRAFNRIDVALRSAGIEAVAGDDLLPRNVRGHHGRMRASTA